MKDIKKELTGKQRIHKWVLLILGIFLLADGLGSVYFGNSCLNSCLNNSDFGNLIR